MRKILLTLVTMLAAVGMNAQEGTVNMYIEVGSTSDLKNIPVTLYMDNTVEITGFQVSIAFPEGLTKANCVVANAEAVEEDDEDPYWLELSSRAVSAHKKNNVQWFSKTQANVLIVSVTSGNSTKYFKESTGALGTLYFDGSSLGEGDHVVKLTSAYAFHDASGRYDAAGYHTPEQSADYQPFEYEAKFKIESGSAVGVGAIKANNTAAQTGIYNIAGQRMNGLQKGINIVNGQKVIVK
ncbi:MAG: hypothetical protein IJ139_06805 [Bacteroidaceae bacterium]|nr:hypothetical protein [Bacteroidaceae bacterium]